MISVFGMLFPPRLVGSALGGLKKKIDLISLKKNPNPPGPGLCLTPPKLQAHTFFEYSHGIHDTIFGAVYLTGAADIHKANVTVTY